MSSCILLDLIELLIGSTTLQYLSMTREQGAVEMKVGDLVIVHPLSENTYLIVGLSPEKKCNTMGLCWHLYNERIGVQIMYEKWMEVINESR